MGWPHWLMKRHGRTPAATDSEGSQPARSGRIWPLQRETEGRAQRDITGTGSGVQTALLPAFPGRLARREGRDPPLAHEGAPSPHTGKGLSRRWYAFRSPAFRGPSPISMSTSWPDGHLSSTRGRHLRERPLLYIIPTDISS